MVDVCQAEFAQIAVYSRAKICLYSLQRLMGSKKEYLIGINGHDGIAGTPQIFAQNFLCLWKVIHSSDKFNPDYRGSHVLASERHITRTQPTYPAVPDVHELPGPAISAFGCRVRDTHYFSVIVEEYITIASVVTHTCYNSDPYALYVRRTI